MLAYLLALDFVRDLVRVGVLFDPPQAAVDLLLDLCAADSECARAGAHFTETARDGAERTHFTASSLADTGTHFTE